MVAITATKNALGAPALPAHGFSLPKRSCSFSRASMIVAMCWNFRCTRFASGRRIKSCSVRGSLPFRSVLRSFSPQRISSCRKLCEAPLWMTCSQRVFPESFGHASVPSAWSSTGRLHARCRQRVVPRTPSRPCTFVAGFDLPAVSIEQRPRARKALRDEIAHSISVLTDLPLGVGRHAQRQERKPPSKVAGRAHAAVPTDR